MSLIDKFSQIVRRAVNMIRRIPQRAIVTPISRSREIGERHQLVIQLYFVEELNLSEIAAVLSVSVPRVHQLKAAALAQMRKALEPAD